ncbi:1-aminocyclopropane-1-carboxylate deaminase [Leptospira santarosai]|uniref:1-aminocyclopropane-1-carboxylate deaminase n=1 Tax=Leptospira santarosai TaxID=28183 RepID=UPI0024AF8BE0|nr:1-aminocyclopropane-1-carboxylate deaminase [Leptospira santarosai]MDI7224794.1 1-aminocyclopropane-1-carboxylate deaminase [Leptospira santarosai]
MHPLQVYFRSCLFPICIQTAFKTQESELSILRDDRLAFGAGTKFRKFLGIENELRKKRITSVLLQGEIHSNALAAFAFLFRIFGYTVETIAYSRDPFRVTSNSLFVKKNSQKIQIVSSRKEWRVFTEEFSASRQEWKGRVGEFSELNTRSQAIIPEYGFSVEAFESLKSLWMEINPMEWDWIVVDLGSGMTWLSALEVFKEYSIPVLGMCVGLKKNKMISWLKMNSAKAQSNLLKIPEEWILESDFLFGFGNKNLQILEYCNDFYRKTKIPIEPIYSGRTLYTIERLISSGELKGKILYIHQGGLWNFLDSFDLDQVRSKNSTRFKL